jgi:hypothetical protein
LSYRSGSSADSTPSIHDRRAEDFEVTVVKKRRTTATSRSGVNYARTVVEEANCCYQPVEHDNDFGIDGLIEVVEGEELRGVMVGAQVKSGASYCTPTMCSIPADPGHRSYWAQYPLPVVGIVYDPGEQRAYWVDIKKQLGGEGRDGSGPISFPKTVLNRFDHEGFRKFFLPVFLRRPIVLDISESVAFATGGHDLHQIGIRSLYHGHIDDERTWDTFINLLRTREPASLDPLLIYFLAHIPGHPDIAWAAGAFAQSNLRLRLRTELAAFSRQSIEKLLAFVDEHGFERGSIGQSVDAIIRSIPHKGRLLREIASDGEALLDIRRTALVLIGAYEQRGASRFLHALAKQEPRLAPTVTNLLETLSTFGMIHFY